MERSSHLLSAVLCELGASGLLSGPSAWAEQGVAACPVLRSAVLLPTAKQLIFAAHTSLEAPDACHPEPSVIPRSEPGVHVCLLLLVLVLVVGYLFSQ